MRCKHTEPIRLALQVQPTETNTDTVWRGFFWLKVRRAIVLTSPSVIGLYRGRQFCLRNLAEEKVKFEYPAPQTLPVCEKHYKSPIKCRMSRARAPLITLNEARRHFLTGRDREWWCRLSEKWLTRCDQRCSPLWWRCRSPAANKTDSDQFNGRQTSSTYGRADHIIINNGVIGIVSTVCVVYLRRGPAILRARLWQVTWTTRGEVREKTAAAGVNVRQNIVLSMSHGTKPPHLFTLKRWSLCGIFQNTKRKWKEWLKRFSCPTSTDLFPWVFESICFLPTPRMNIYTHIHTHTNIHTHTRVATVDHRDIFTPAVPTRAKVRGPS